MDSLAPGSILWKAILAFAAALLGQPAIPVLHSSTAAATPDTGTVPPEFTGSTEPSSCPSTPVPGPQLRGDGGRPRERGRRGRVRRGSANQLRAVHNKTVAALVVEGKSYHTLQTRINNIQKQSPSHMDLLEGCAGKARCTELSAEYGLGAIQPADLQFGWDLLSVDGRARWKHAVSVFKPLLVVWGHPCTLYCVYNNNINYRDNPQLLQAMRDKQRPLLQLAVWTLKQQLDGGRMFLFENPPNSSLWSEAELGPVIGHPEVFGETVHMCMHGSIGARGLPIRKSMRFMTNSVGLLDEIAAKCDQSHVHEVVEGPTTKLSQQYPDEFCHKVLGFLQKAAHQRNPVRFNSVRVCAYC